MKKTPLSTAAAPLTAACLGLLLCAAPAAAAPVTYQIDPSHTYPSFEADHMGLSKWRGKFNQTKGTVVLDKAAGSGTVNLEIAIASIDFGHEAMNKVARGKELFDSARHPTARYLGRLVDFVDGAPTRVEGELRLRGVAQPVTLKVLSFKCMPHPMIKGRDWCGADAEATLNREDFGMSAGKDYGFKMDVLLRIQVEAVEAQ